MPPPRLPLTPASSTEIAAMDKPVPPTGTLGELSFSLPPAALSVTVSASPSHSRPGKKRSASDIDLPPPPTRSRKIIQMKPKEVVGDAPEEGRSSSARAKESTSTGKKKASASASTAAGRKIARKTAHSLIERRRRSKMNEEFATLKDMIPACQGQDMHKLAILQASIEYMNYLEQCIADLKAANASKRKEKEEEEEASSSPPKWSGPSRLEHTPTTSPGTSPALSPHSFQPPFHLQFTPPETTSIPRHTTHGSDILPMVLPSPSLPLPAHSESPPFLLGRRQTEYTHLPPPPPPLSINTSVSVSPSPHTSIQPQPPSTRMDHEASAALLMLNSHDLREGRGSNSGSGSGSGRRSGISVHDLLSH